MDSVPAHGYSCHHAGSSSHGEPADHPLPAWDYILEDIAERPFITLGFGAWLILLALAFTSTRGWIRRLGRRWRRLHRLVYVAALAGGVHFFWRVKADEREPLVFLAVIICLLAVRVVIRARGGAGTSRRTATEAT